jgi:hypothetical protein
MSPASLSIEDQISVLLRSGFTVESVASRLSVSISLVLSVQSGGSGALAGAPVAISSGAPQRRRSRTPAQSCSFRTPAVARSKPIPSLSLAASRPLADVMSSEGGSDDVQRVFAETSNV